VKCPNDLIPEILRFKFIRSVCTVFRNCFNLLLKNSEDEDEDDDEDNDSEEETTTNIVMVS
jgi:hypothetical protein